RDSIVFSQHTACTVGSFSLMFLVLPPPRRLTVFPYTTLFRSTCCPLRPQASPPAGDGPAERLAASRCLHLLGYGRRRRLGLPPRSEEHTSELQSRENLVCRLLLEKKK